jgi:8-oxo-dGTP pyrophosphatase MutT (NUDIX family)
METKEQILQLIQGYLTGFPEETERTDLIQKFVTEHEGTDMFDRKNFVGHLTASAFIVDNTVKRILLLKHKFLNRWLQPGGHIDITDRSLEDAARRETEEETGIPATSLTLAYNSVFDFDSHWIPENPKKQESPHFHHDVRFLFTTAGDVTNLSTIEATGFRWLPLMELEKEEDLRVVALKIRKLLK